VNSVWQQKTLRMSLPFWLLFVADVRRLTASPEVQFVGYTQSLAGTDLASKSYLRSFRCGDPQNSMGIQRVQKSAVLTVNAVLTFRILGATTVTNV